MLRTAVSRRFLRVLLAIATSAALAAVSGCGSSERAQRASEIAALRGQVDELRRGQETSAKEVARLSGELKAMDAQSAFLAGQAKSSDEEFARIKAALDENRRAVADLQSGASDRPAPAAAAARSGASPSELYSSALAHVQSEEPDRALMEFTALTKSYPEHPLASNAQYWVGEVYFRHGDVSRALVEFQRVVDGYPKSAPIPEALLKIGACYRALKDQAKAREVWQELVKDYPSTSAASQAQALLGTPAPTGRAPKTGAR